MMLKKEREVNFLLEKHLDEIKEWLKVSSEALSSFLSDDIDKINHLLLSKNQIHTSLEAGCQEIWERLCNGAYLPVMRGDLYGIVKSVDRIADAATLACETFLFLQPEIPIKIKNQLATIVRMVFFLFRPVHESVLYYLRGDDVLKVIRKNVDAFLVKRAEVNNLASNLKSQIYSSDLDYCQKLHINECVQSVSNISSQSAESNDQIQLIMVKIVS
jgi:predicted phosphate transport protein (TIGR00153 family)